MFKQISLVLIAVVSLAVSVPAARAALVFHAGFDEGSGTSPVATYLGQPLSGTMHETTGYSTTVHPFAPVGSSSLSLPHLNSQDSAQFIVPGGSPLNQVDFTSGTIAAWVNLETFSNGNGGGHRILSTRTGADISAFELYIHHPDHSKGGWVELHAGSPGGSYAQYNPGEDATKKFSNDDLGQWYFVAASWDSTADQMDFYVGDESGTLDHIGAWAGTVDINPTHHLNFHIGGLNNGGKLTGLVDDVYLFNNSMAHGELLQLMGVPEPASVALMGFGLGLVGLLAWRRRRSEATKA